MMSEPFEHHSTALDSTALDSTALDSTALDSTGADNDGFDRERVLRLLDQLERDVTAVEAAMVHAESGDTEAYAAAVSTLEPRLVD
jgi:hypothetical protein